MVLLAKDIMDTSFLSLDETVDALTAARRMVDQRRGYVIVTRGGPGTVSGIATEWDYLSKVVAAGADPVRVTLKDLASPVTFLVGPDTPTDEVVTNMSKLGVRRMIVRTDDRVLGVITARNVLASFRPYIDRLSAEIAGYQSTQTPLG